MNRNLFAHALRASPFVVTAAVLIALAVSSGPLATSAQQSPAASPAASPAPKIGGAIAVASDFSNALKSWKEPTPTAAELQASSGGSDTWYQDCTSGKVSFAATGGWCWVPELRVFYNVNSKMMLDAFSHRLMLVNASHTGLQQVIRQDDEDLEPPTFALPAGTTPAPLSLKCVPDQARLIGKHVSGLRTNAAHTDSPTMRATFTAEADWWAHICS